MYDVIPIVFIKIIKLFLFEHLICIIEYVIRLWNYVFMLFILNCPRSEERRVGKEC